MSTNKFGCGMVFLWCLTMDSIYAWYIWWHKMHSKYFGHPWLCCESNHCNDINWNLAKCNIMDLNVANCNDRRRNVWKCSRMANVGRREYVRCGWGVMYGWTVGRYEILVIRLQAITTTTHSARHQHRYNVVPESVEAGYWLEHRNTEHIYTDTQNTDTSTVPESVEEGYWPERARRPVLSLVPTNIRPHSKAC